MKSITIFEPAMCCSTGACGPNPNKELVQISSDRERLKKAGIQVKRHNLSQEPQAFAREAKVQKLLKEKGLLSLPITIVDGEVKLTEKYPTTAQLNQWFQVK